MSEVKEKKPRKRPAKKVAVPAFQPYQHPGGKPVADDEAQRQFDAAFRQLSQEEQKGAIWLVNQLTGPFLAQGYKKMIRFVAQYVKDVAHIGF